MARNIYAEDNLKAVRQAEVTASGQIQLLHDCLVLPQKRYVKPFAHDCSLHKASFEICLSHNLKLHEMKTLEDKSVVLAFSSVKK